MLWCFIVFVKVTRVYNQVLVTNTPSLGRWLPSGGACPVQAEGDPGSPPLLQDARWGVSPAEPEGGRIKDRPVLSEASGWDCPRAQPEPDSGSVCRFYPQRTGQLWTTPSELVPSCFLRPASMWSESRLHFLPAVGSPAGRFNLCVRVSASCFFFFFCREVRWG